MKKVYYAFSKIGGSGLFAKQKINKDEIIFRVQGTVIVRHRYTSSFSPTGPNWIAIGEEEWLIPSEKNSWPYLNHSCEPNSGFRGLLTIVAMIRQTGASAAYLAATGAKIIFASKYSDVGGIGVSMSYLDNVIKNQREGLTYNILSTGKFKDAGDPNKPLTTEERALIMRDLAIAHQDFIEDVATNRGLDVATVTKLADGSTMPGEMALENHLIDRIGGRPEVELYLAEQIGAKPEFCWE